MLYNLEYKVTDKNNKKDSLSSYFGSVNISSTEFGTIQKELDKIQENYKKFPEEEYSHTLKVSNPSKGLIANITNEKEFTLFYDGVKNENDMKKGLPLISSTY